MPDESKPAIQLLMHRHDSAGRPLPPPPTPPPPTRAVAPAERSPADRPAVVPGLGGLVVWRVGAGAGGGRLPARPAGPRNGRRGHPHLGRTRESLLSLVDALCACQPWNGHRAAALRAWRHCSAERPAAGCAAVQLPPGAARGAGQPAAPMQLPSWARRACKLCRHVSRKLHACACSIACRWSALCLVAASRRPLAGAGGQQAGVAHDL